MYKWSLWSKDASTLFVDNDNSQLEMVLRTLSADLCANNCPALWIVKSSSCCSARSLSCATSKALSVLLKTHSNSFVSSINSHWALSHCSAIPPSAKALYGRRTGHTYRTLAHLIENERKGKLRKLVGRAWCKLCRKIKARFTLTLTRNGNAKTEMWHVSFGTLTKSETHNS